MRYWKFWGIPVVEFEKKIQMWKLKICCIQTKESMPWCVTEIMIQIFVGIRNFGKLSWNWIWKWVHTMDSNDHQMKLWIKLQCTLP